MDDRRAYPDPETVDWLALQYARAQAVSGVAYSIHLVAQAVDEIGLMLSKLTAQRWTPISDRIPAWPDEREPRFQKEPPRCPHGHPLCCGHHDLEDGPIHRVGMCHGSV